MYRYILRPILFRMEPESAHALAVSCLRNPAGRALLHPRVPTEARPSPLLATDLCGIPLAHPVGLAAGFDKSGELFRHIHRLGFAFSEIGTITGKPQPGNPKPRLFRLARDKALINRMGFNNPGAETVAANLAGVKARIPIGGNIGKSKAVSLDEAIEDYAFSFKKIAPYVDYFAVNVSSPNTPGLRELQRKERLRHLLSQLMAMNRELQRPFLLKIAPDLDENQLEEIALVVEETGIHGVIATNTTIQREGLRASRERIEAIGAGGLSGAPLKSMATRTIRFLRRRLPPEVSIVGVGGIFTGADAYEKILAGARCLQIYTGLIYRGPNTVQSILTELAALLKRDGFSRLTDAVGSGVRAT